MKYYEGEDISIIRSFMKKIVGRHLIHRLFEVNSIRKEKKNRQLTIE